MIQHVILTGDFLATRQSEQASNLRWLGDLLHDPIAATGVSCAVGFPFDREAMLTRIGRTADSSARHCWIDPDAFDEAALTSLSAAVPPNSLIVGYELQAGTRAVLSKAGIAWIDLWLHPVRFCDDILMSVASGHADIHRRAQGFALDLQSIRAQARLLKIQNYRGFNRPTQKLGAGACLLVGQTPMDKSILQPNGFATLGAFQGQIDTLIAAHARAYFAPHPKAQRIEPAVQSLLDAGRLTLVNSPAYLLLADPDVVHVAGLSSSVIEEARYFGKDTTFFIDPPVAWSDAEHSVPVFQDFAFPHFWSDILSDVAKVMPHPPAQFLAPKNKLRDALSFDWGYPHIDRDRFDQPKGDQAPHPASFEDKLAAADVVSFDIFDTLITRRVADPRDVFDALGDGFRQKRLDAAGQTGRDEPSLADIYQSLPGYDLGDELAHELALAQTRPAGKALYDAARATGKRIILVTDMYLDTAQITQLLKACGYSGWQAIYVSNQIGLAKRTGQLWGHVLVKESLQAGQLFHIGDNAIGDISKANEHGIETHHLPTAAANFANSGAWAYRAKKTLGRDGTRLLASIHTHIADQGPASFTAKRFGHVVLGPLLVGFAQWLSFEARRKGITHLHFLTREGDVMRAVFEALQLKGAPQPNTLYASRALVAPLAIGDADSIEAALQQGLNQQTLGAFFKRLFNLDPTQLIPEVLQQHGFGSANDFIGPKTERTTLKAIALAHKDHILKQTQMHRETLKQYLESQRLDAQSALVDIGYNGTVQRAYSDQTRGLYMGLFDTAQDLVQQGQAVGWLFQGARKSDHTHPLCKHRTLWEVLLCAPEGTVIGLDGDEALRAQTKDTNRQEFVRIAHAAAVDFARDWAATGNHPITPAQGQAMLAAVLDQPDASLAHLLKSLEFEDSHAHDGLRPLIGTDAADSLWKEGFAALQSDGDGFTSTKTGARRPAWKPWGAYGVLGWRHVLPIFVAPVIGHIGEPHDVDHYKEDPIGFFRGLSNARFRKIGQLLYPWSD